MTITSFPNDRERDVRAHLKRRLKALGGELRKCSWFQRNKAPDELVLIRPQRRYFLIELKRPGQRPDTGQQREIEKLRDCGMEVYVADTREMVDAILGIRS